MTIEVGKPLPYFCPACQAFPQAGYCKLAGCPTNPAENSAADGVGRDPRPHPEAPAEQDLLSRYRKALEEIADQPTGGIGCNPKRFVDIARQALNPAESQPLGSGIKGE